MLSKRYKAMLYRIPLATAIISALVLSIFPSVENRMALIVCLMLIAFNSVVCGAIVDDEIGYESLGIRLGAYIKAIATAFGLSFILGILVSFIVLLPIMRSLFWTLCVFSVIPYAVMAVYTFFYFAFVRDKT